MSYEVSRLPPGNVATTLFPVIHTGAIPPIDRDGWRLSTTGEVFQEIELRWEELQQLPRRRRIVDMHCVAGWSVLRSTWEGVSLVDVLALAGVGDKARFIMLHANGGYSAGVPLDTMDDVLLTTHRNGEMLTPEHGGLLRAIVLDRYAWKSVKWVQRIELMSAERYGYFEWYGYHPNANPWAEERFVR